MCKRQSSIEALVERSKDDLAKITEMYRSSLRREDISQDLKIEIKNYCGNLRSALDYLAWDICEALCCDREANKRVYFPICRSRENFELVKNWYGRLSHSCPDMWWYLESVQPYHEGYEWLGDFSTLNNENKHADLVAQTKLSESLVCVVARNGAQVSWKRNSVTFASGVEIGGVPIDPDTQLPLPDVSQKVTVVEWVDFWFEGLEGSALDLLCTSLGGIGGIIHNAYQVLSST